MRARWKLLSAVLQCHRKQKQKSWRAGKPRWTLLVLPGHGRSWWRDAVSTSPWLLASWEHSRWSRSRGAFCRLNETAEGEILVWYQMGICHRASLPVSPPVCLICILIYYINLINRMDQFPSTPVRDSAKQGQRNGDFTYRHKIPCLTCIVCIFCTLYIVYCSQCFSVMFKWGIDVSHSSREKENHSLQFLATRYESSPWLASFCTGHLVWRPNMADPTPTRFPIVPYARVTLRLLVGAVHSS